MYKLLEELKEELKEKQDRLNVLENNENTDEYDEMLDQEGNVNVSGLTFSPSAIVKEMDPTAYRCGMNDFNDSLIAELNDEIESLESDIKEAEKEAEEEAKSEATEEEKK